MSNQPTGTEEAAPTRTEFLLCRDRGLSGTGGGSHHDVHDHHYKHDLRPFLPSRPGRVGLGRAGKPTGSDLVGSDRSVRVAWVRNHFGSSAHGLHIGLNSHRHRWLRPRLRVQGTEPPQSVAIQSLTLARWEHHPIGNDCPRQPFNKPFLDTQRQQRVNGVSPRMLEPWNQLLARGPNR